MRTTINIKGSKLNFCNFFISKDENVKGLVEYLECELDKEYSLYSLNKLEGQQNRMAYSANNGLVNIQLGNTTTYLFTDTEGTIYGVDLSTKQIIEEAYAVGLCEAITNFKVEVGYDSDEYSSENWYSYWKKGKDGTIDFCKNNYDKLTYHGDICNEMWRIMAAEPETIEKHDLTFDHYHDEFVEIPIKPGIYEITSLYDNSSSPIYFTIKENK